jgi:hypothetical protein
VLTPLDLFQTLPMFGRRNEPVVQEKAARAGLPRPPPPDPKTTSRTQGLQDVCARSEGPPSRELRETATIGCVTRRSLTYNGFLVVDWYIVIGSMPDILLSLVTR